MQFGRLYQAAPELRVRTWINGNGEPMDIPLRLDDLGSGYKIIFAFQHWCPGRHSHGFPTLQRLYRALKDGGGFGFCAIQTVFRRRGGKHARQTPDQSRAVRLTDSVRHDLPLVGDRPPSFMEDYHSAGTPWFTVIDPSGQVVFADFRLDADRFLAALDDGHLDIDAA